MWLLMSSTSTVLRNRILAIIYSLVVKGFSCLQLPAILPNLMIYAPFFLNLCLQNRLFHARQHLKMIINQQFNQEFTGRNMEKIDPIIVTAFLPSPCQQIIQPPHHMQDGLATLSVLSGLKEGPNLKRQRFMFSRDAA